MKQETFMMLKPDAFATHHDQDVIHDLEAHGFMVEKSCVLTVDMEIMKTLLSHYEEVIRDMKKSFNFPGKLFNSFYYDGPHIIMPMKVVYEGDGDIITLTRELVGKTNPQEAKEHTIRRTYSDDNYDKAGEDIRLVNNVIHASDSHESAKRELDIWATYLK